MRKIIALCVLAAVALNGCHNNSVVQTEAQAFINRYTDGSQVLQDSVMAAKWDAAVHIFPGDSSGAFRIERAERALAMFTADEKNRTEANRFLANKEQLTEIQVKQLEMVLHEGALTPNSLPAIVQQRIHNAVMLEIAWNGFYPTNSRGVITDYESILSTGVSIKQRAAAWKSLEDVGKHYRRG